jgi:hypothetical protein
MKQYDWTDWLDGMRSKAMKAGAEAITTQLGAWFMSNGLEHGIQADCLKGIGLSWKTAIVLLIAQFAVRVVYAAALYVQQNPDPTVETPQPPKQP